MLHLDRPLQVGWSITTRSVQDDPNNILEGQVGGRLKALRLSGTIDQLNELFHALPKRRLIVLGEPGAGKTVAALQLTLDILARRKPGEHVPVLLDLSSWNPKAHHLNAWIARKLADDHYQGDTAIPTQLVESGLITPILDGFDELPKILRAIALDEIQRAAGRDGPLVLVSRSSDYEETVATSGLAVFGALAIELQPLDPTTVIEYLQASSQFATTRWNRLSNELRSNPHGVPGKVLSLPLMAFLARAGYADPASAPDELLTRSQRSEAVLENHLLDHLIPATYRSRSARISSDRAGQPTAAKARKWLRNLTALTDSAAVTTTSSSDHEDASNEIAWWRLPTQKVRVAYGIAVGVLCAAVASQTTGLVIALSLMIAFWFRTAMTEPRSDSPVPRSRLLSRQTEFETALSGCMGEAFGTVVGLLAGVIVAIRSGLSEGVVTWMVSTYVLRNLGRATSMFLVWTATARRLPNANLIELPQNVIRSERMAALLSACAAGAICCVLFLWGGFTNDEFRLWLSIILGVGLVASEWGVFCFARLIFASSGRLPLKLITFLDDATRRGILRRTGVVYQFRHVSIRDYLRNSDEASCRSS